MKKFLLLMFLAVGLHVQAQQADQSVVTAVKAGRLVDPESGQVLQNQVILIERGKFTAIGANLSIPKGARVIDLSSQTILPGLVDAHNHLALTYKMVPERN
ncbi:MAG: hypothetical protein ACKORJ_07475, partial [Bacteroidota bacterium]